MNKVNLDGQNLIFLSQEDISNIIDSGCFNGEKLRHPDIIKPTLQYYREIKGVEIAIITDKGQQLPICFVTISGHRYRVHIEDVICEHCNQRSGVSGTPGVWELYLFCSDPHEVLKNAMSLPVKKCVHCSKPLNRRHTIWFEHEQCS